MPAGLTAPRARFCVTAAHVATATTMDCTGLSGQHPQTPPTPHQTPISAPYQTQYFTTLHMDQPTNTSHQRGTALQPSRRASQSLAMVPLFAALVAVLGLIPKIDLPFGVPITLQSLAPMLAMLLFFVAVAAGLPLLAGGRGGLGVFMAPTTGYLLGFAASAWTTGLVMSALPHGSPRRTAVAALIASLVGGLLVQHAMGVTGLVLIAKLGWSQAFFATLVFVPGDIVKCLVCAGVVHTVARGLPDWRFAGRTASMK
jgi:biotin transport system substrate-specific component